MQQRVVLDANIYISALIKPTSHPGIVLRSLVEHQDFEIVLSQDILDELKRAIFYPKVRKYIKKNDQEIVAWLDALVVHAFLPVCLFSYDQIVEEDPDDDKYIIAALESRATYLISEDKHLLNLKEYQNVKIVTAIEFFHYLSYNHPEILGVATRFCRIRDYTSCSSTCVNQRGNFTYSQEVFSSSSGLGLTLLITSTPESA